MVLCVELLTWEYSLSAWASWAIFWLLWAILALIISLPKSIRDRMNTRNIISSIAVNLAISFLPWISLSAHLWWLIGWFIVSYILIKVKRPNAFSDEL